MLLGSHLDGGSEIDGFPQIEMPDRAHRSGHNGEGVVRGLWFRRRGSGDGLDGDARGTVRQVHDEFGEPWCAIHTDN